jgi:hypothetical protein
MSSTSFFVGVRVMSESSEVAADTCKTVTRTFEPALEGLYRGNIGPVEVLNLETGEVEGEEPVSKPFILQGYGYWNVVRVDPNVGITGSHAKALSHLRALREAIEQYQKENDIIDRYLEVAECWSGGHHLVAIHYAPYARGGTCRFQGFAEHGERYKADESTAWKFARFYKETRSQRAREAINELFRGWEDPPRWFVLAGAVAP